MDSSSSEVTVCGVVPAVCELLVGALGADAGGLGLASDAQLLDLLTAADGLVSLAEAARARVVQLAEERQSAVLEAGCSTAEWLHRTQAHSLQRCRVIVKDAVRAGHYPGLVAAQGQGVVSADQAMMIARVLHELPDDFSAAQVEQATATMVDLAARHDPVELAQLGWHLLEVIAPERAEEIRADQLARDEKRAEKKRGLALVDDHHGSCTIRGHLTSAEGEELAAILAAYADSAWKKAADDPDPGCPREKKQLWADALMNIVRAHATRADAPTHGGDRPRVTLLLSLDALLSGLGQMALSGGAFISAAEARRLACDCDLIPAVLNALGIPLDVGRSSRLVTPALRTAVVIRDRGCVFPGCDRPPAECEAHHLQPWWAGGPTSLDNLVLLCPRHHRRVEPGRGQAWNADDPDRWQVRLAADRLPEVIPPRGYDPHRQPLRHTRYSVIRH